MTLLDLIKKFKKKEDLIAFFKSHGIKCDTKDDLILMKYRLGECVFDDEWKKECRGSIIDFKTKKFVCRPFDKFFNYGEMENSAVEKFLEKNWDNVVVSEKLDGTFVKVYCYNGEWFVSTNSSITADKSPLNVNLYKFKNYRELFDGVAGSDWDKYLTEYAQLFTHMFELCTPLNKVVLEYKQSFLGYLGSRHNETGEEFFLTRMKDFGCNTRFPHMYKFSNIDTCLTTATNLPKTVEGYVVSYDGYRVKMKSSEYVELHHRLTGDICTPRQNYENLKNGEYTEILVHRPELKSFYDEMKDIIQELKDKLKKIEFNIRKELKEKGLTTRKEQFIYINTAYKHSYYLPILAVILSGRDTDKYVDELSWKYFKDHYNVFVEDRF